MNTLHAGLMCTALLTGTIAGLFGCMSAVRRHRRFAFAVCLAIASLDFAALAVLLSRLPESETLSPVPWTATALSMTALSLFASFTLWHKSRRQLSPISVKESCDHLPSALPNCKFVLLCDENSDPELSHRVMIVRQDRLIDAFLYASVTPAYLTAALDAL